MKARQKDNSTLSLKVSLRRNVLQELHAPAVVCETHGGYGHIYERCYRAAADGVVFEKDSAKVAFLARQRPEWAVYECDSTMAMTAGVGSHLPVNFVDIDPYGEPWPVLDAFLVGFGDRLPARWGIAVNDGLRQKIQLGGGWDVASLHEAAEKLGAATMYDEYLAVCRWLLEKKIASLGFRLARWAGYHCGANHGMTHYGAIMVRI